MQRESKYIKLEEALKVKKTETPLKAEKPREAPKEKVKRDLTKDARPWRPLMEKKLVLDTTITRLCRIPLLKFY